MPVMPEQHVLPHRLGQADREYLLSLLGDISPEFKESPEADFDCTVLHVLLSKLART